MIMNLIKALDPEMFILGGGCVRDGYLLEHMQRWLNPDIMHSKHLILIAKGKSKASIIRKALAGPVSTEIPASVVQLHPNCEILLDADAASEIARLL